MQTTASLVLAAARRTSAWAPTSGIAAHGARFPPRIGRSIHLSPPLARFALSPQVRRPAWSSTLSLASASHRWASTAAHTATAPVSGSRSEPPSSPLPRRLPSMLRHQQKSTIKKMWAKAWVDEEDLAPTGLRLKKPEDRPRMGWLALGVALCGGLIALNVWGFYRSLEDSRDKATAEKMRRRDEERHRRELLRRQQAEQSPTTTATTTTTIHSPREERPTPMELVREFLEPFLTALRFLHLAFLFLPVILLAPVAFVGKRETTSTSGGGVKGDRAGAIWWYGLLVGSMQHAGPSFIKLAQWAGSRTDLFPARLCEAFGRLHSSGKPHPFRHTRKVIERVFGRPIDEVFEEFSHEPLGCGAIAQVYRGTLRSNILPPSYHEPKRGHPPSYTPRLTEVLDPLQSGTPPPESPNAAVAIKILHPRVHQTIRRDLKIMNFFATVLNALPGMEWLSFPDEVRVFGEMMNQQLDLSVEGHNLETFEKNFQYRRGAVSFPRPVMDFTTKDILVEEYEKAIPLESFLANGGGEYDEQLASMGLDAFLNMLLLDNWTHGDLHPGNIMVKFFRPTTSTLFSNLYHYLFHKAQPASPSTTSTTAIKASDEIVARLMAVKHDKAAWLKALTELYAGGWQPELVFIDAGLVTQLDNTNRRNFLDLFAAIAEFDGYKAGILMAERCKTPNLVIDKETFALKIQHVVLGVKQKSFTLAQIRISDVLTRVLAAVRESHVKMEGDFVNTILSILLLEGIGRQLDPNLDLFKSALPILRQVGRGMGSKREALDSVSGKDLGAMLKMWVWLEARQLASAAVVDWEPFVRYDWLSPNL